MTQHQSSFPRRWESRTPTVSPPLLRGRRRGGRFRLALPEADQPKAEAIASLAGMTCEHFLNLRAATLILLVLLILAMGCDQLPGKPTPEERWKRATEVTDF